MVNDKMPLGSAGLNDEGYSYTIEEALNRLFSVHTHAIEVFENAASQATVPETATYLTSIKEQHERFAREIGAQLKKMGDEPRASVLYDISADVRQLWTTIKTSLADDNNDALLASTINSEQAVARAYKGVLDNYETELDQALSDMLTQHLQSTERNIQNINLQVRS